MYNNQKMCKKLQINLMLCLFFNYVLIKIGGMPTIQTFDIWSDNVNNDDKLNNSLLNNNLTGSRESKGKVCFLDTFFFILRRISIIIPGLLQDILSREPN